MPPEARSAELRRGLAAFERGEYGQAIESWQRVWRQQPSESVARVLAETYFRRGLGVGRSVQQIQAFHQATTLAPDRAVYHFHLGLAYARAGQSLEAADALEQAYRCAPTSDRIRYHLALVLLENGSRTARAGEIIDAMPDNQEAARLRALVSLRAGLPAAAGDVLGKRKSMPPLTRLALAVAQLTAGDQARARETASAVQRSRGPLTAEARQAAALVMAIAQLRTGELDRAGETLSAIGSPLDPRLRHAVATAWHHLASELVVNEQFEPAIAAWNQVLELEPTREHARRCRTHLHDVCATRAVRRGDYAAVVGHGLAVLAEEPGNCRVLHNVALAEERQQKWGSACAYWLALLRQWRKELRAAGKGEEVAALRARVNAAERHLAELYEAADDLREAAHALERALQVDSTDLDLRLRLGQLYLDEDNATAAIGQLRQVMEARPDDVQILLDLGVAYDLKGDDRRAQEHLERALALEPDNPAVRDTLASVHHGRAHRLERSGRDERVRAEYERAIELDRADPTHYQCLADFEIERGRADAAKAAWNRVLALNPEDIPTLVTIAGSYLRYADRTEADRLIRRALRLDQSEQTRAVIGLLYYRYGEEAKAKAQFKQVLKGNDPFALNLIGRELIEEHADAAALPYLERAVALDDRDPNTRISLALVYAIAFFDATRAAAELDVGERLAQAAGDAQALAVIKIARAALQAMTQTADEWLARAGSAKIGGA